MKKFIVLIRSHNYCKIFNLNCYDNCNYCIEFKTNIKNFELYILRKIKTLEVDNYFLINVCIFNIVLIVLQFYFI